MVRPDQIQSVSPVLPLFTFNCELQVRQARELLDEAVRELRGVDRGEGGAGQGRADGKGLR